MDPRPDQIYCYIGQTNSADRFKSHLRRDKWILTPKRIWIDQLLDHGLTPEIHLLETCSELEANTRENYWTRIFEYSPMHILVNGYLERFSADSAQVHHVLPPTVGCKKGVLADLSFIIDLTYSYNIWLMKKVAISAHHPSDIDITVPSWKYWEAKLGGREFQIVDARSGNLQHPFITQVPEQCVVVGLTAPDDCITTRRRLGLFVP